MFRNRLYDIIIDTDQRSKDLGTATLNLLDAWARAAHVKSIALNVFGDNAASLSLYRKQGFQVDAIQMHKLL